MWSEGEFQRLITNDDDDALDINVRTPPRGPKRYFHFYDNDAES